MYVTCVMYYANVSTVAITYTKLGGHNISSQHNPLNSKQVEVQNNNKSEIVNSYAYSIMSSNMR